ncbi:ATP-binding cassette domain-containing protein [Saccharibacter sp. 17.LH.SD]|uniref:ATP-binding cassette domain-containing protein n=1 Tax=Saccharibacter sp. 17.LH.SD TaxID=2689393 RepID=UPI00136FDDD6|nr:ATP-binding cassette domain-containing protein [Saccharibacter sp. 17.LH.SD]MXV45159.1 ATP-binding cassette domain-containing protein [Saccharibacter sp. 17.LH.SD]
MRASDIVCHNLQLIVGPCVVLSDATLKLSLTGITVLRGNNGTGKTSFLHSLLGLEAPQQGSLTVLGTTPQKARPYIGYMPQKAGEAAPMIPVIDHVIASISGTKWGFPLNLKRRHDAMTLLTLTNAQSLAHRPIGVLSGGERQRIALAQALSGSPQLLILDEPLAALDPIARQKNLVLLNQLHQQLGLNILMTAHESLTLDGSSKPLREIWLKDGKLYV